MVATSNYFADTQAQLNESQKKYTELWKESKKELEESQKKLAEILTQSLPQGMTQTNPTESVEKTMNFQRELINAVINAQQVTARLTIETQKQFWDDYFKTTEKMKSKVKAS